MIRTLTAVALCLCATFGMAQTNYMNYQGKLVTGDGSPLQQGQATLEVNLYDAPINGTKIWGPFFFDGDTNTSPTAGHAEQVSVMTDGRFNVILGPKDTAERDISAAFQHHPSLNRFIELKVNAGEPILPRQQFLSAPYAFQASRLPDVSNTANGNVGIGNESPAEKLDVTGNVQISGGLKVGGKAAMYNAKVTNNLEIGARTLSTSTTGVLTLNGDIKVNGDIEFGGRMVNFKLTDISEFHNLEPATSLPKDKSYPLNLSADEYFCTLQGITFWPDRGTTRMDNGAWLSLDENGKWLVNVRANGQGNTTAMVGCFKFQ